MKNITDRFKVPREEVALIAITTGVPICILVPISTWAVFLFEVLKSLNIVENAELIPTHFKIAPFAVYPFVSIFGTLLLVFGILPHFLALRKARDAMENQEPVKASEEDSSQGKEKESGRLTNFFLPITALIVISILSSDIVLGALSSLFITLVWLKSTKQITISRFVDFCIDGMQDLLHPLVFMLFAFCFGHILMEMHFADLLIKSLSPFLIAEFLPVLSFWIVALIVFGGIDVWAVMPLVIPVFVPLAELSGVNIYLVIGAILSGISFGTQMCFISESHILISETVNLKPVQQVLALMPYGLIYAAVSTLIYIVLGFVI